MKAIVTGWLSIFLLAVKGLLAFFVLGVILMLSGGIVSAIYSHDPCFNPEGIDPTKAGVELLKTYLFENHRSAINRFIISSYLAMLFLLLSGGYGSKCKDEQLQAAHNFSDFCISPAVMALAILYVVFNSFAIVIQRVFRTRNSRSSHYE